MLTALKETETALSTYATELDHHAALAAARDRADEALRLAQTQYRLGAISFLDLLQAEATAVAADQALAASDQTLAADQVAVFQALGGGWEDAPKVVPPAIAGVTPKISGSALEQGRRMAARRQISAQRVHVLFQGRGVAPTPRQGHQAASLEPLRAVLMPTLESRCGRR